MTVLQRARPVRPSLAIFVVLACSLVACKVEKKSAIDATDATSNPVDNFENKAFDPQKEVGAIWDKRVLPSLQARAVGYAELRAAIKGGLDAAGAKYGYRERGEGAPWSFVTQLKGRVAEADTTSSAATVGVDVDGDGKPDATVQIGPVLRGTSIRDNLDFISFSSYSNQVEFAQLANAFNQAAFERALKTLPRDHLVGAQVVVLGTFTTDDADETPLVTPVRFAIGGAP